MATLSMEQILERVKELKAEAAEKDDVIRDQQLQIDELEKKIAEGEAATAGAQDQLAAVEKKSKQYHDRAEALQQELDDLKGTATKAEEMLDKLSDVLG